jgi:hypothetical protein
VIDLNQFVRNGDVGDLGALKTTTQKFYRINGGSTQLEVSSDIVMPDRYAYLKWVNAMWRMRCHGIKLTQPSILFGTKPLILTKQYQTVKAE